MVGVKLCRFGGGEKIFLKESVIFSVKPKTIISRLAGGRTPFLGPLVSGVGVCEKFRRLPDNIPTNQMHEIQTVIFASYLLKVIIIMFS